MPKPGQDRGQPGLSLPQLPGETPGQQTEGQHGNEDRVPHYQPGFWISLPADN